MNELLTIRKAGIDDVSALTAFNLAMARETEGLQLDYNILSRGVRRMIHQPDLGFYLLAEREAVPVGGLMITYEWSDWRNGLFWWVQSVYVLPDYRGRGIYRELYQQVRELAFAQPEVCGFRLYVEQDNTPAQQVYTRLGMKKTGYLLFEHMAEE